MGFWKVLGGVAAGVGAVVALPVAGPIGAVTAIGAAVGAGVGGLAGAAASVADEEEVDSARREGKREATAKYDIEVKKLIENLKVAEKNLESDKSYFELLVALFAVGMATAAADGEVSGEEVQDLDDFVAGIGQSKLPPHVVNTINELRNNPPSFQTAMKYVEKVGDVNMELFESVIQVIAASDGIVTEEETALLQAFRKETA